MAGVLTPFCSCLRGLTTSSGPRRAAIAALSSRRVAYYHIAARRTFAWSAARKHQLQICSGGGFKNEASPGEVEPPSFGFAFDIDGVLLHVAKPIPGAPAVLDFLNEHNIPFILLTNGGGKHENERVEDLKQKLGVQHLSTDNFIQSHTPFRELVDGPDGLRDKTVLVTGSDPAKSREIFQQYGFRNVVTPWDIYAAYPAVFPFETVLSSSGPTALPTQPLPKPIYTGTNAASPNVDLTGHLKIDAMFVTNDPREWALDIQLLCDLLLSHRGYLGTHSPKNGDASLPNGGWQQDGQPRLYFSNADLVWSTGFHLPRFGQGAFQAALRGVWSRITGGHELECTVMGKPHGATYRFAERVLARHRRDTLRALGHYHDETEKGIGPLKTVYMVGDNPESDIAGANTYASESGTEWVSVLVKTGVYAPERGGKLEGRFEPRVIVDDVSAALRWALAREGYKYARPDLGGK